METGSRVAALRGERALAGIGALAVLLVMGAPGTAGSGESASVQHGAIEYQWFNEGTPAGKQTVVHVSGEHVVSNMRIRWNNRDFVLRNEMHLDQGGYVVRQKLSGRSAFGATIDESFERTGNVARWSSTSENGSKSLASPAFYVPGRTGATESVAALVRRGIESPEGVVPLLPSGEARIERVVERAIGRGERHAAVALYSITGLKFAPTYIWLDEKGDLFSYGFWGLSMIPSGWGSEVAQELARVQAEHEERHYAAIARDAARTAAGTVVIEQVDVLDVESGQLVPEQYVTVRDGRIAGVSGTFEQTRAAHRVDGRGKTLIPGLWDMHAHTDFYSYYGGILNIAGGVTSVRDMGSDHDAMMRLSRRFDTGELVGPFVYRAGFIDKKSPFAASRAVETLEDAINRVNWYADRGYIQIKLYSSVAPEWVQPLADLAHERGLRVSGHVPAFMTAEQAVGLGYDEIQHINMLFLNFLAEEGDDTRTRLRFYLYGDEAGNLDLQSTEVTEFVRLLAESGTVVDPTIAVFDSMIGHRAGQPDPMFESVIDRFPIGEFRSMHSPGFDITDENADAWNASRRASLLMLRKLYRAGVQIVPGTDALPGFALHRELELYAEAGIPNSAILRMATIDSARIAGADGHSGSIDVGKRADLVLLCGNPLVDIGQVRRLALVLKGGTIYRPGKLQRDLGIRPASEC